MTKEDLVKFTEETARLYESGKIKCPVHLGGDNEEALIDIFKNVGPNDWIFGTWRSSYQWLLSGRDPVDLRNQIIAGHSMHVFGNRLLRRWIVPRQGQPHDAAWHCNIAGIIECRINAAQRIEKRFQRQHAAVVVDLQRAHAGC